MGINLNPFNIIGRIIDFFRRRMKADVTIGITYEHGEPVILLKTVVGIKRVRHIPVSTVNDVLVKIPIYRNGERHYLFLDYFPGQKEFRILARDPTPEPDSPIPSVILFQASIEDINKALDSFGL